MYQQTLKALDATVKDLHTSIGNANREKTELQKKNHRLVQVVDEITTENSLLRSFLEVAKQEKNENDAIKKLLCEAEEKVRIMENQQRQLKIFLEKSIDDIQSMIREII